MHKVHQDDLSSVSKKAVYSNICKTVQNMLSDIQYSWLSKKAEQIQFGADRKNTKKFHDALKTVYGQKSSGATLLLSEDESTLLTDKDVILERGTQHFNSVLNRPSTSMTMLSEDCHRQSALIFQPSRKPGKRFHICLLTKH